MYETMIQRYEIGCMMLMKREKESVLFLGTAFLCHPEGYLLTAAHLIEDGVELVTAPTSPAGEFSPLFMEMIAPLPLRLAQIDRKRNVALLEIDRDLDLKSPLHIIGDPEEVREGAYLLTLGVSFGHLLIHHSMVMHTMLSAKLLSLNETKLMLFDTYTHPGGIGGPLVSVDDGRVIGVCQGPFLPLEITGQEKRDEVHAQSHISYAVSIEYGRTLMQQEGLKII